MKQNYFETVRTSLRGVLLLLLIFASVFWVVDLRASADAAQASAMANKTSRHSSAALPNCTAGKFCTFFPIAAAPIKGDLVLQGVEITQAVQNTQNSIHLVSGKKTVLRIYTSTRVINEAVPNVKVSVLASNLSNVLLSDSPKSYYATVPLRSSRADYQSSINIPLPDTWLSGTINVTVALDADNAMLETDETNNRAMFTLVFHDVPALDITVVPVRFHNMKDGRTYPAPSQDTVSDWIQRTYPIGQINLTWHTPYDFSGDLTQTSDFSKLLNAITTIKTSEGAPASQVYYGLIPTTDGTHTWFYGGYAGLGWVGSRTAIGLEYEDQTSQLAAHEIGHNLGAWHTPCGGATSTDPAYPYPDGSIGEYGLDVLTGTVYPPSIKDVMSYCSPKWVSNFTYEKLYNGQLQSGASRGMLLTAADANISGSRRGLLVRANIRANGVELLPSYVLPGQVNEAPEAGEYQVEVFGEQGEMIAQAPVRAFQASEDSGLEITSIHALIALPDLPAARMRLLKDGQVLAEQALETGRETRPEVEESATGRRLHWEHGAQHPANREAPGLVRYSTDGGKTWTTLGVDVTGSELSLPDSAPEDATFEVIGAGN